METAIFEVKPPTKKRLNYRTLTIALLIWFTTFAIFTTFSVFLVITNHFLAFYPFIIIGMAVSTFTMILYNPNGPWDPIVEQPSANITTLPAATKRKSASETISPMARTDEKGICYHTVTAEVYSPPEKQLSIPQIHDLPQLGAKSRQEAGDSFNIRLFPFGIDNPGFVHEEVSRETQQEMGDSASDIKSTHVKIQVDDKIRLHQPELKLCAAQNDEQFSVSESRVCLLSPNVGSNGQFVSHNYSSILTSSSSEMQTKSDFDAEKESLNSNVLNLAAHQSNILNMSWSSNSFNDIRSNQEPLILNRPELQIEQPKNKKEAALESKLMQFADNAQPKITSLTEKMEPEIAKQGRGRRCSSKYETSYTRKLINIKSNWHLKRNSTGNSAVIVTRKHQLSVPGKIAVTSCKDLELPNLTRVKTTKKRRVHDVFKWIGLSKKR